MNLDDNLHETQRTIGQFEDNAQLSQAIKFALRRGKNWEALSMESKEALELISSNIAAILTGDATGTVHWHAIAIMARLRSKALETPQVRESVVRHIGEVLNRPLQPHKDE